MDMWMRSGHCLSLVVLSMGGGGGGRGGGGGGHGESVAWHTCTTPQPLYLYYTTTHPYMHLCTNEVSMHVLMKQMKVIDNNGDSHSILLILLTRTLCKGTLFAVTHRADEMTAGLLGP